jgi:hypothetical protein
MDEMRGEESFLLGTKESIADGRAVVWIPKRHDSDDPAKKSCRLRDLRFS